MADADRHDLTMFDFDHHPSLATLRHRIRSLDLDGLGRVAGHERANRAPVRTVVEARLGRPPSPFTARPAEAPSHKGAEQ